MSFTEIATTAIELHITVTGNIKNVSVPTMTGKTIRITTF